MFQNPIVTNNRQEEDRPQEPELEDLRVPQSPPHVQGPPVDDPEVGGGLHRDELPEDPHPLLDGARSPPPPAVDEVRPRRATKPNIRYTDYEMSSIERTVLEPFLKNLVINEPE